MQLRIKYLLFLWIFCTSCGLSLCFEGWEDYLEQWETEEESDRMFPFGEDYGDTDAGINVKAGLNFRIPYYGHTYTDAWIVPKHGHIELLRTADSTPQHYTDVDDTQIWPDQDYPEPLHEDPPFISMYFTTFYGGAGNVYWRSVNPEEVTDEAEDSIVTGMLAMISDNVRIHVVGRSDFTATHGMVVTWYERTYDGCGDVNCQTNTMQTALVTDGNETYVVYNFYELTWVGGDAQGCVDGMPPLPPNYCIAAQVGFNVGYARRFDPLPYSMQEADVLRLAEISGSHVQGRFIYGVHGPALVRGGCAEGLSELQWPLEISPRWGSMLGGFPIYFSAQCFDESLHTITCRYSNKEHEETITGKILSPSQAVCIAPAVRETGKTKWTVLVTDNDSGGYVQYAADFTIVPPAMATPLLTLDEPLMWMSPNPDLLRISWDPYQILYDFEDIDPRSLFVDIRIMGWAEFHNSTDEDLLWEEVITLESGVQNEGHYEFRPDDIQCDTCHWMRMPPVGVVYVARAEDNIRLNSRITPLGWWVEEAMEDRYGDNWPSGVCDWWYDLDQQRPPWADQLIPCPQTAAHAFSDTGRFWPDMDCEDSLEPHACHHNCYVQISTSYGGGVSRCCYDDDGNLLYTADSSEGSTSYKASPYGSLPYNEVYHVPSLSHWFWDKLPELICCNWTGEWTDCRERYKPARASPGMEEYHSPRHAIAYGDPHFTTFDGTEYTFNSRGEFWLYKAERADIRPEDNFYLQGRFQQPEDVDGEEIFATVMTAVALQPGRLKDQRMPFFQVSLNYEPKQKLVVLKGNNPLVFEEDMRIQEIADTDKIFKTFIVDNSMDGDQSNFTFHFDSGVSVNVFCQEQILHVVLVAPPIHFDSTRGLFGLWNNDRDDDLITSGDDIIDPEEGNEYIHDNFGTSWQISYSDSLFTYIGAANHEYFQDSDFRPYFTEPELPEDSEITEDDVDDVCGDSFVCRYDYKTMLNAEVGAASLIIQDWFRELDNMTIPIAVCGYIDVPNSIREVTHYLAGGTVTFVGCEEGYQLKGKEHTYTCEDEGDGTAQWKPGKDVECKSDSDIKAEETALILAITIPILLICIIVAIILGIFFYRRYKKNKENEPTDPGLKSTSASAGYGNTAYNMDTSRTSVASFDSNVVVQSSEVDPTPRMPYDQVVKQMKSQPHHTTLGGSGDLMLSTSYNPPPGEGALDLSLASPSTHSKSVDHIPSSYGQQTTQPWPATRSSEQLGPADGYPVQMRDNTDGRSQQSFHSNSNARQMSLAPSQTSLHDPRNNVSLHTNGSRRPSGNDPRDNVSLNTNGSRRPSGQTSQLQFSVPLHQDQLNNQAGLTGANETRASQASLNRPLTLTAAKSGESLNRKNAHASQQSLERPDYVAMRSSQHSLNNPAYLAMTSPQQPTGMSSSTPYNTGMTSAASKESINRSRNSLHQFSLPPPSYAPPPPPPPHVNDDDTESDGDLPSRPGTQIGYGSFV